ncbi:MAG: hypothetical protein LBN27_08470 [Prevotellaceae bacterium]|jgi:hypothetical protein|nr:hypothetical protein [Prevotellaceae bacterium]
MKNQLFKKLWLVVCGLVMGLAAQADIITSTTAGGNWNATGTWVGNILPTVADDVVIDGTVTINANNQSCKNLTVNSGKTLRFSANSTTNVFTVNGDFILNGTFSQTNNQGWPIVVYGDFIIGSTGKYSGHTQNNNAQAITMKGAGKQIKVEGTIADTDNRFFILTIDLPSPTDVISLNSDIAFVSQDAVRLNLTKGILNAQGHTLNFKNKGQITVSADGQFGGPLTSSCEYTVNDLPSIYISDGTSGSNLKASGNLSIKDFNPNGKDNWNFPVNSDAVIYVFGTFTRPDNKTNINNNTGTWYWGEDSWYKTNTAQGTNHAKGTYAATGSGTKSGNVSYTVPTVIQDAIDACASCTQPTTTLTVSAESATICTGTGTNIQVQNSEVDVLYALFAGSTQVGADVTGDGGTINLPTGNLTATTAFTVKTSENNTVACPNKKIGDNVTVTVNAASVAGTAAATAATIGDGSTAEIKLTDNTGTIQWQQSEDGVTNWQNLPDKTAATLTTEVLSEIKDYFFHAVVTSGVCDADTSGIVTISVIDHTTVDEDATKTCNAAETLYMILNTYSGRYMYESASNVALVSQNQYYTERNNYTNLRSTDYPSPITNPEAYWILSAEPATDNFGTWKNFNSERYLTLDASGARINDNEYRIITTVSADGNNSNWKYYGANSATEGGTYFMNGNTSAYTPNYVNAEKTAGDGNGGDENNRRIVAGGTYNGNNRGTKGFDVLSVDNPYNLTINTVATNLTTITLGETFTATAEIENTGTADISAPIKVKFAFNGQYFYSTYSSGLTAGATTEVQASIAPNTATEGEYLTATVNSNFSIIESTCADNDAVTADEIIVNDVLTNVISGKAGSATIIGYYDILGKKLLKAPETGVYIVKYDNGKTEKTVK